MIRPIVILLITAIAGEAAGFVADSARGLKLFDSLACVQCHSVNGKGGSIGPDLGRIVDRGFTPATLAATLWNHAPAMWAAMRQQNITAGYLNEQGAADLFAYFYSARFLNAGATRRVGNELSIIAAARTAMACSKESCPG